MIAPHRYKITISYDGTTYRGWQKTRLGPSIEETLEKALHRLTGEVIALDAASRTDAGVHAEGQVVAFQTSRGLSSARWLIALNGLLPPEIRALSVEEVPQDFHPTLDNKGKEYQYKLTSAPIQLPLERLYAWHIPYPLDIEAMKEAAERLVGTHDFSAFCNSLKELKLKDRVRTLRRILIIRVNSRMLIIKMRGDSFLFRMARNLVGTLVYVGLGKITPDEVATILTSKKRTQAGICAPAHGLTLTKVYY